MLPSRHIIVSLSLGGGLAFFTQSLSAGLLCFFSGVLIDVDHFFDYAVNCGLKGLTFKNTYQTCAAMPALKEKSRLKRIFIVFHMAEIAILLWIAFALSGNIYLMAIALGYTAHLILDSVGGIGILKPQTYFVTFRIKNGFKLNKLLT